MAGEDQPLRRLSTEITNELTEAIGRYPWLKTLDLSKPISDRQARELFVAVNDLLSIHSTNLIKLAVEIDALSARIRRGD